MNKYNISNNHDRPMTKNRNMISICAIKTFKKVNKSFSLPLIPPLKQLNLLNKIVIQHTNHNTKINKTNNKRGKHKNNQKK